MFALFVEAEFFEFVGFGGGGALVVVRQFGLGECLGGEGKEGDEEGPCRTAKQGCHGYRWC